MNCPLGTGNHEPHYLGDIPATVGAPSVVDQQLDPSIRAAAPVRWPRWAC
jgi:hypothetical protein